MEKPHDTKGVLGDGTDHPGKYNMALVRRAIKAGWPISDEVRKSVVDQMARVVENSDNDRDKIGAAKVLVAADVVNARREDTDSPKMHLHGHMVIVEEIVDADSVRRDGSEEDPTPSGPI